MLFYIKTYTYI